MSKVKLYVLIILWVMGSVTYDSPAAVELPWEHSKRHVRIYLRKGAYEMTKEDLLKLAKDAGFFRTHDQAKFVATEEYVLLKFARSVAQAEREECAQCCESKVWREEYHAAGRDMADAIRFSKSDYHG